MTHNIQPGTMLVADGITVPEEVLLHTEHCLAGWSSVIKDTSAELGRKLKEAGWTFFFMASEISTRGFGFNEHARTDRAIKRMIDTVELDNCNCIEITQVEHRSIFGFPFTSLTGRARHIQRDSSFYGLSKNPAGVAVRQREWLYDQRPTTEKHAMRSTEAVDVWEDEGGSGTRL